MQSTKNEKNAKHSDVALPIRLRAYERLTLLLNRVEPKTMLAEELKLSNTASELKTALLAKIQSEYNHNVSQQIYVSEILWEELEDVQHNLTELITASYAKCEATSPASLLAEMILGAYYSQEQTFIAATLLSLKQEVKDLL